MGEEQIKKEVMFRGLSDKEVEERIGRGQINIQMESPSKTTKEIIIENTCTYFNLIFAIISILLISVGSFRDLTFLPIIIANTAIGIFQQLSAKRILDKLSILEMPKVSTIREGNIQLLEPEELVLDDLVIFEAGHQICADAVITSGSVRVNESLLTGEADEITKKPGDTLLSGSFIVSGRCYATLSEVGASRYIAKLSLEAKKLKEGEQSEMIRSLNIIVKVVGSVIIPISLILFYEQHYILHTNFRTSVTSTIAAVIGMIPEGLYLLTSIALAVSVKHLAKRRILVHDMKCIETLARVNVLCVDKTGTITENKMEVKKVVPIKRESYRVEDEIIEKKEEAKTLKEDYEKAIYLGIGDFVHSMLKDNATSEAMAAYFKEHTGAMAEEIIPFSSSTKWSGVVFEGQLYMLGAPEFVLKEQVSCYQSLINQYSLQGYRVLVYACKEEENIEPLALILLSNTIRKEAKQTFDYFKSQGVEVKVISGDNALTVSKVAEEAGIDNASSYINMTEIQGEEELKEVALKYTVFGRVTPNQKRELIRALKGAGNTVAMTGDGVNDVLALKDADCSIAMASGSEVAAEVSQLVLLDSNFACMPSVVREGRRVVNNIERSASLFLVKNIFSFMMSIFAIVFMVRYPLQPSQVSLISMFTIGIPAFLLAFEVNDKQINGSFISNVLFKALPAGLTDFFIVSALIMFGFEFGVDSQDISTASVLLMAVVGFMILYHISKPINKWKLGIIISMAVGLIFCSIFMSHLFAMSDISLRCTLLLSIFTIASEPIFRYLTWGIYKLRALKKLVVNKLNSINNKYE